MIDCAPRSLAEVASAEPFSRPNIVLVVLDCASEAAISELERRGQALPFPQTLQGQMVRFRRSVSTASWTLPSHASLLTGLAPWEHGVHGRGTLRLPSGISTLAEELGREGYATALISSNGFLGRSSGLTRGFQESHIGSWSETVSRVGPRDRSPIHFREGESEVTEERESPPEAVELSSLIRRYLMHYPGILDSSSRFFQKFTQPDRPFRLQVSPWVEEELRTWVRRVDRPRPVFCLVNYLDAHEPYFCDREVVRSGWGWLKYARISQDQTDYLIHPERTQKPAVGWLNRLYLGRVRYLLERLGLLVQALEEAHRWDETLLIVTSDHGQAFGGGRSIFHGLSIDDSVTRVPLWVRFPGGRAGGKSSEVWTSGLDVAQTIRSCATGTPVPGNGPGPALNTSARSVACVSDGVVNLAVMARFPEATRARLDHVLVAVYTGDRKLCYDACHDRFEETVTSLESGPPPKGPDVLSSTLGEATQWAREIGVKMLRSNGPRVDHLEAWGY